MPYGLPFTQLEHLVKLEKLHNVNFIGGYENESACWNFIIEIADGKKKKIEVVNWNLLPSFAADQQEVIYVIYVDPDTDLPVMNSFETTAPENCQDAPGLKEVIISAFSRHDLDSALKKMVFLLSNGASVNSRSNFGLIRLLQEDNAWLAFLWCFSHTYELSLKDTLFEFLEPVDNLLTHLFYIYSNSTKQHQELKSLYHDLKGQYDIYDSGVKPLKGGGTRWVDHKLWVMGRLLEKFSLYGAL